MICSESFQISSILCVIGTHSTSKMKSSAKCCNTHHKYQSFKKQQLVIASTFKNRKNKFLLVLKIHSFNLASSQIPKYARWKIGKVQVLIDSFKLLWIWATIIGAILFLIRQNWWLLSKTGKGEEIGIWFFESWFLFVCYYLFLWF